MSDDVKLKPCPWCGGPAKACVGCSSIWVECTNVLCGVEGPRVLDEDRDTYPEAGMQQAADLWNERRGMEDEAREILEANDRLLRLRHADSWFETALLQLLHENGIEPGSRMLIEAMERAGVGFNRRAPDGEGGA